MAHLWSSGVAPNPTLFLQRLFLRSVAKGRIKSGERFINSSAG
jgi:hypothetical protein